MSRQNEISYYDYYGYPYYWAGPHVWGPDATAMPLSRASAETLDEAARAQMERRARERESFDPHLRSGNEVAGYKIEARDASVGGVEDLLFDEQDWTIRFLVIDTHKWLPGRHVVVPVERVDHVSWSERADLGNITANDRGVANVDGRECRVKSLTESARPAKG